MSASGHCKFKASETSVVRVVILLFGAVTVGFKVRLPEVFTLTSGDYEAMHGA